LVEIAGWRVKVSGIAVHTPTPRRILVEAALVHGATVFGGVGDAMSPDRIAFAIVHDARPACFVLLNWWAANRLDLHQRYFTAPLEQPHALHLVPGTAIGCVWELAVVAHERAAWVRHVLDNHDGPDFQGYLDDGLVADI
jgi:hypothetical protein